MKMASWFYQRALARHGAPSQTCLGQDCFAPTFMTLAVLGAGATAAAAALYLRTAAAYAQVHSAALREDDALATVEPHEPWGEEEEEEEEELDGFSSGQCTPSPREGPPASPV